MSRDGARVKREGTEILFECCDRVLSVLSCLLFELLSLRYYILVIFSISSP